MSVLAMQHDLDPPVLLATFGGGVAAIGSASARPSALTRAGSPRSRAMMVRTALARATESWKFDGKRTVRTG